MIQINILILHSASLSVIKKFCEKNKHNNIYICTFPKNKGCFSEYAKEIYLQDDFSRIYGYKVISELEEYTEKLFIDEVVFITSNKNGENYDNIKVAYNSIKHENKILLNNELEPISSKRNFNNYLNEMFYENQDKILGAYIRNNRIKRKIKKVKKIMFIYESFYVGGVTNLIYEWIKKMNTQYEIVFSCYSNGTEINKFKNIHNLKLYVNRMDILESNAEFDYYYYLKDVMEKERPDVVLISGVATFLPSIIAAIDNEVPKIYPIANAIYYEIFGSIRIGEYLRYFEKYYDSIIAVSESVKNSIMSLKIKEDNIRVIYGSSIDLKSIKYKKCNKDKKIISCISRLSKEKGIDTLIKAISKVDLRKYDYFEVNIVGEGEEKECLVRLTKSLKLEKYVKFLGYRTDIYNILNQSYITVLPSHSEGLGLSILESMAYRKMVIATNVGGIPEVINHNYNGFLIEDNDSDMLAKYIEICLDDVELVNKMNENAYNKVLNEFNIDITIRNLLNMIEEK